MMRIILSIILAILTLPSMAKYQEDIEKKAKNRYIELSNSFEPEAVRLYCDSMKALAASENMPMLEYYAEHLLFLQCMANDSSEQATLEHLRLMRENCLLRKDSTNYFDVLNNEVMVMLNHNHKNQAQTAAKNMLEEALRSGQHQAIILSYFMMANVQSTRSNCNMMIKYALKAVDVVFQDYEHNKGILPDLGILLSWGYTSLNKWNEAISWADTTIKYDPVYREAYYIKAEGYLGLNDKAKFLKYFNMGEELGEKGTPIVQFDFLPYYRGLASAVKGDFTQANMYLDSVLTKGRRMDLEIQISALKGDHQKAYDLTRTMLLFQDSIRTAETSAEMDELLGEVEHSQKMREIEKQRQHEKMIYVWSILFLLFCIGIISTVAYWKSRRSNKMLKHAMDRLDESNSIIEKSNEQLELASLYKRHIVKEMASKLRSDLNIIKGYSDTLASNETVMDAAQKQSAHDEIIKGCNSIESYLRKMSDIIQRTSLEGVPMQAEYKVNDLARQAIKEEWGRPWELCPVDLSTEVSEDVVINTDYYRIKAVIRFVMYYIHENEKVERVNLHCQLNDTKTMAIFKIYHPTMHFPKEVIKGMFDRYFMYNNEEHEGLYAIQKLASTINANVSYEAGEVHDNLIVTVEFTPPIHENEEGN